MGRLKQVGIGIGVSILGIVVFGMVVGAAVDSGVGPSPDAGGYKGYSNPYGYYGMSVDELKEIRITDGRRDILRNWEDYVGQVYCKGDRVYEARTLSDDMMKVRFYQENGYYFTIGYLNTDLHERVVVGDYVYACGEFLGIEYDEYIKFRFNNFTRK